MSEPEMVAVFRYGVTNTVTCALTLRIARKLNLPINTDIVQANTVRRDLLEDDERIEARMAFDGVVIPGRDYLIMDEKVVMGGTIADLRSHIERRGGHVIGAVTLMGARGSEILAITPKRLTALRERFGQFESGWRERFRAGFDCLTEAEAQHLLFNYRIPEIFRSRFLTRDHFENIEGRLLTLHEVEALREELKKIFEELEAEERADPKKWEQEQLASLFKATREF
jgi:hypothetical protein